MEEYRKRRSRSKHAPRGGYGAPKMIDTSRSAKGASLGGSRQRTTRSAPGPNRAQYVREPARGRRGRQGLSLRSQRRTRVPWLTIVLVALAVAALALFLMTRPASARISVTPEDATIVFAGSTVATGTLEIEDLDPGPYELVIERTGYESVATTAELKRGRRARLTFDLVPLPQPFAVTTHPAGAEVSLTLADGQVLRGTSPFAAQVFSGPVTLEIAMSGRNRLTREISVDSTLALEYYLDPEGQILHGNGLITTQGAPKGVSVTHDGAEAWTSILNGPPSIQIFDPRTGKLLGGVDIGEHGAVEVIFNRAGTLAYTSQMETAKCFEIDVRTRTVLREFDTGSAWTKWVELSPDEKTLYASNWSGSDVSVIDLTAGALVRRVPVSKTPRGMYATDDGRYLYVAGFDSGDLERIDLVTFEKTVLFTEGGALRHIVADERTGRLFVSDMSKDLVWVHDMATGATTKFVDVNKKPNTIDLTPDGRMLFVSCRGENNPKSYYLPGPEWGSILVIDTTTGRPLDALVAGNQPTALDVSDDGKLLVFSDFLDNRLRVYEIPPHATFAAGGGGRFEAHKAEIRK